MTKRSRELRSPIGLRAPAFSLVVTLALSLVAASVSVARAAANGPTELAPPLLTPPPADHVAPWQPVTFHYDGNAIDLLEAVRLTLAQDPNLLLQQEDVRSAFGRLLEQRGPFDWTLNGQATYEHRRQHLTPSVIKGEEDKRNTLRDVQSVACPTGTNLGDTLADLQAAQTTQGVDIRNDQGFNAQLRIIEAAILADNDASQRAALEQTRLNLITTEIATVTQARDAAVKTCNDAGAALGRLGSVPDEETFDLGRLELRLDKLTRSGILFEPFVRGSYDSTQFVGKHNGFFTPALDPYGNPLISPSGIPIEQLISFGGKDIPDLYTTDVGFSVNVPLLRGRGAEETAAGERAAAIDYEASRMTLEHAASQSVLDTTLAYWNLVAAQQQVQVLQRSVDLQHSMVETTRALIDASELPGAEMPRAEAGEANARAQLASAQRDEVSAAIELLRTMGLSIDDAAQVPTAAQNFPPAPDKAQVEALEAPLAAQAASRRLDVQASRQLVESGQVLARAAFLSLRPRLDVKLSTWMAARGEASYGNALDHWAGGPSWSVEGNLEKPFGNHTARGRLLQSEAQLGQRQISAADLARQVQMASLRAGATLAEAIDQLASAERAATAAEETIHNELEKLRLGESTLIDSIVTEQQRTSAQLAAIDARLRVADLLAQLRFESGTILEHTDNGPHVTQQSLTSLPGGGA